jgi:hypothetical protein
MLAWNCSEGEKCGECVVKIGRDIVTEFIEKGGCRKDKYSRSPISIFILYHSEILEIIYPSVHIFFQLQ